MIESPIQKYHQRFIEIKAEKGINTDVSSLSELIEKDPAGVNNYFMAAIGMSTLMLRIGAVIQLCSKLQRLDDQGDALFMKQVIDNLRESLPSDTSWKNIWMISVSQESTWSNPIQQTKGGSSLIDRFITFRNRFVHQQISIIQEQSNQLIKGIEIFDEMADLITLFYEGELHEKEGQFYWNLSGDLIPLHPYLQVGEKDGLPYIFQGLYDNKQNAAFLNTFFGDEIKQGAIEHLEPAFEPLKNAIKGGAGQVFDHSERLAYYRACFVGRERERNEIIHFTKSDNEQNILSIKSPAGMGKGALMADVIYQLQNEPEKSNIPILYHFCGAGMQNSLHATLYHLILQGKRNQWWSIENETIARKLERLPSKYIDLIHLFQELLDEHFKNPRNNPTENLVILIDGLDEAQVAYSNLQISDWFFKYNEKEEQEDEWRSSSNIRWIFTYRCEDDGNESFYHFPKMAELAKIEILQPLQGLETESVNEAFREFNVSDEFKKAVILNAEIN